MTLLDVLTELTRDEDFRPLGAWSDCRSHSRAANNHRLQVADANNPASKMIEMSVGIKDRCPAGPMLIS
jgi:hypothetical protein